MPAAWGVGLATIAADGTTLDTWYRRLGWGEVIAPDDARALDGGPDLDPRRGVGLRVVHTQIDTDAAAVNAADVYLRLHLLSHRLALPRTINLDGIYGLLANVAWTNLGPVPVDTIDEVVWTERREGRAVSVHGL